MTDVEPPTDEQMAELADWIRGRPAQVVAVMDRLPPACYVRAVEGRPLLCPRPGEVAVVVAYSEHDLDDGGTGISVTVQGAFFSADCRPDWLEPVDSEEQFATYRRAKELAGL